MEKVKTNYTPLERFQNRTGKRGNRGKIDAPNTYTWPFISWFGTQTSIKSGGLKVVPNTTGR